MAMGRSDNFLKQQVGVSGVTIVLGPELETRLASLALASGTTPEEFVLEVLRQRIIPKVFLHEPRDEFERNLRAVATPCGVSLSNEALSSEGLYD